MLEWNITLAILVIVGVLFFASAVYALCWAANNDQLKNFEQGAETIFTDEEPLGVKTDAFPGKTAKGDLSPASYHQSSSD